ncbi:hypothetical protein D3C87_1486010 [compost metagenome]
MRGTSASISRISSRKNSSSGRPLAIISRRCAWPSSKRSAAFRSEMSRDTPTMPMILPRLLRNGTLEVISQRSRPLVTIARSSMPKIGSPVSITRRSTSAIIWARCGGCRSKSVLPMMSRSDSSPLSATVTWLAMRNRPSISLA